MKHRRFHQPAQPASTRARLSRRREVLVYAVFGLLWISGGGWLVFHYFLQQIGEFGALPNPLETWWLRLHGAAAFASLWLLGLLWPIHLVPGWKSRRRPSGVVLSVFIAVLVLSGYLLYYAGGDRVHEVVALVHWLVGLALAAPLLLHGLRGRRAPTRPHDE